MKNMSSRPIGVFDSGLGGLTVVRGIRRELPHEDIIYFGDTARVPYGNKSKSTIIRFSGEIMRFMVESGVKMVVVACNTASSLSMPSLKRCYPVPVTGVIEPGVEEAVKYCRNGKIGVIGTKSTVSSGSYNKALEKIAPGYRLYSKSCPLFVPLVENGFIRDKITFQVADKYLKELKGRGIDTLILGCTHYPVLKSVIGKVMGKVRLVDSSTSVAVETKRILETGGMIRAGKGKNKGKIRCFVSDDPEGFGKTSRLFLREGMTIKKVVL